MAVDLQCLFLLSCPKENWAWKAIVLFIVYELSNNAQTSGDKDVMLWHTACTLGTARDTNQISSCTKLCIATLDLNRYTPRIRFRQKKKLISAYSNSHFKGNYVQLVFYRYKLSVIFCCVQNHSLFPM